MAAGAGLNSALGREGGGSLFPPTLDDFFDEQQLSWASSGALKIHMGE